MSPIIFHRDRPMPRCKHCGVRMGYYVPGMADADHAHPDCEARAAVEAMLEPLTWRRRHPPVRDD